MGVHQFSPRVPASVTVNGGAQTKLIDLPTSLPPSVLYITNNSNDTPIYLGFTPVGEQTGNAVVDAGITVFPQTVFSFTGTALPNGCTVWATCESGSTATVGIQ